MDYDLFYERNVADVESWTIWKDKHGRKYARADKKNKQVLLHKRLFDTKRGCHLAFKMTTPSIVDGRTSSAWIKKATSRNGCTGAGHRREADRPEGVTFHKASNRWNSARTGKASGTAWGTSRHEKPPRKRRGSSYVKDRTATAETEPEAGAP